jgi:hypothetical protein
MIKLRIDVDYPYPSRAKSFLYVALRIKKKKSPDFLKNARIIAKMINESPKEVLAYWFFTPYTIPDKKLLDLLNPRRNEVALHVASDPYQEWKILEKETGRKLRYYTIHGTEKLSAQLLWGRKIGEKQKKVPSDFPLKSFHEYFTLSLDVVIHDRGVEEAKKVLDRHAGEDCMWTVHPEWLFKKGRTRGPFYLVLKDLLEVDKELNILRIRKRGGFAKIASDAKEHERSIIPNEEFIEKLSERGIDVFTFLERKWCCPILDPPTAWIKTDDNVALLEIKDYENWWSNVGKKTRNMVRKAEKSGIKVTVVAPSEKFAEGISKIFNETPIRQERAFSHYGEPFRSVLGNMFAAQNSTFIGAFLQEELVGFIEIRYGDNIAVISQILSMQKHWDKSVNNVLIAKAVEVCALKGERWLMYGRIGNHPSLDRFKESNGFIKSPITRYYIPLTWKGKVAIRLGLHREFQDALPKALKSPLIPVFNWMSRNRLRLKLRSTPSPKPD